MTELFGAPARHRGRPLITDPLGGEGRALSSLETRYPKLFAPLDNPGATGRFVVSSDLPSEDLIGNSYVVPRVGSKWLYFVQSNGRLQFPGGKKEPGESHREALDFQRISRLLFAA